MSRMSPPTVRPTVPPSTSPDKAAMTYDSLLGKPTTLDTAGIAGPGAPPSTGPLSLHSSGVPPLIVQRDEAGAATLTVVEIKRDGVIRGYVGLDVNDHVVIIAKDGVTVVGEFDTSTSPTFTLALHNAAGAAAVLPYLAVVRAGSTLGYLGSDASDNMALIAADGTTVLAFLTALGELDTLLRVKSPHLQATTDVKTPKVLDGSGNQVVAARQAAIAAASTSAASGNTSAGNGSNAAGNPPTQTEFNALVAVVNANATDSNANGTAINSLVTTLNAAITKLNTLLTELGTATGHGLIG